MFFAEIKFLQMMQLMMLCDSLLGKAAGKD